MAKYIDISIIEDWLTEQETIAQQGADPFSAGACIAYEKARMFLKTLNTRNIRQVLKEWSESPDGKAHYEKVADEMRKRMTETPKIKGWVARDKDGTLHFFSSECGDGEPIYNQEIDAWGIATGEQIELLHQSGPFGDLTFQDEPIEVELTISQVIKVE